MVECFIECGIISGIHFHLEQCVTVRRRRARRDSAAVRSGRSAPARERSARAQPGSASSRSARARPQEFPFRIEYWPNAASTSWIVWKSRSSRSSVLPIVASKVSGFAAGIQIISDERARLIHLLLPIEQARQLGQPIRRAFSVAVELGKLRSRHVEKSIEVNRHRRVEDSAHQLRRADPAHRLVNGVGKREAVMRGIPIAKFVAGREARDSKRRSIRNRAGEIRGRASFAQSASIASTTD